MENPQERRTMKKHLSPCGKLPYNCSFSCGAKIATSFIFQLETSSTTSFSSPLISTQRCSRYDLTERQAQTFCGASHRPLICYHTTKEGAQPEDI